MAILMQEESPCLDRRIHIMQVYDAHFKTRGVTATPAPTITLASPPDPGNTVKLYSNAQGIITQKTTLRSTDGLATVTVQEGVIAKNTTGYPLSFLGITAISPDSIPGISSDSAFIPHGMAYDLQPDNSSFSPSVSLNFTVPQAHWGQEYMIKTYDRRNRTWLDLPTRYDPDTGIVTARISHLCCFALFTRATAPERSGPVTALPTPIPSVAITPPPPTAMSIFAGMMLWIVNLVIKNAVISGGLVILAVLIFLYGRKRRRDRILFRL
jgi:hypothetical protein